MTREHGRTATWHRAVGQAVDVRERIEGLGTYGIWSAAPQVRPPQPHQSTCVSPLLVRPKAKNWSPSKRPRAIDSCLHTTLPSD